MTAIRLLEGTDRSEEERDRDLERRNREADARIESARQTNRAYENLLADPSDALGLPYPSLHQIVRRVAPGRLVLVMASTGQGKTTFLLDLLNRWAEAGERMDFLGTEQEPDELRMKWACLRCGVPSWVAINREWDALENGEMLRERIAEDLAKIDEAYGDQVLFVPDKFITLPKIERAAERAYERRSRVLVVDHIDRVETSAVENEYLEMKRVVRRLKELARDFNLVLLVASQVNRKAREGDRLAVYRPPQLHHMQGGATKEQEADVVLGLWRPIRQRKRDESAQEYKALLSGARSGSVEPTEFLEPNTMGIICLKHRTNGSAEGKRGLLRLERGRLVDPAAPGAVAP